MKKIILFLLLFFAVPLFAQINSNGKNIPNDKNNFRVSVLYTYDSATDEYIEVKREADGSLATSGQDQHTPMIVVNFNKISASTYLADTAEIGNYYLRVEDTTGLGVPTSKFASDYILAFSPTTNRFFQAKVLSVNGDTLFLDRPVDSALPDSSFLDYTSDEMAVDASDTTLIFGLRGVSASPIGQVFDVQRIIFECISENAVDLSKFGDLPADSVTYGITLRERNGIYHNIANFKSNRDIAGTMYDWTPYAATNPQQGKDGFTARFTFTRLGVVSRLTPDTDLEFVLHKDNFSSTGMSLKIKAEGHFTTESTAATVALSWIDPEYLLQDFIFNDLAAVIHSEKPNLFFN